MTAWPTINMAATGQNITRLMKQYGMTVRDVQSAFGFSNPQAVYKWKRGQSMPTIDNLVILASMFGVKIDDIIVVEATDVASLIA